MNHVYWMPVEPLTKAAKTMRIGGMATVDDTIDLDQQILQHTGVIDCLPYLQRFGKVNWNHRSGPGDLLGDIVKASIREHPQMRGRKGLWIEADLNPKVKGAREAYQFMKGGGRLGFSVQGVTLDLKKAEVNGFPAEDIKAAFVTQVALTPEPKNYDTFAQILKSLDQGAIVKALTAGAGTDHAQFTGGRALTTESLGTLQLARLAGHFRNSFGCIPVGSEQFRKSLADFSRTWQLADHHRSALSNFLAQQRR